MVAASKPELINKPESKPEQKPEPKRITNYYKYFDTKSKPFDSISGSTEIVNPGDDSVNHTESSVNKNNNRKEKDSKPASKSSPSLESDSKQEDTQESCSKSNKNTASNSNEGSRSESERSRFKELHEGLSFTVVAQSLHVMVHLSATAAWPLPWLAPPRPLCITVDTDHSIPGLKEKLKQVYTAPANPGNPANPTNPGNPASILPVVAHIAGHIAREMAPFAIVLPMKKKKKKAKKKDAAENQVDKTAAKAQDSNVNKKEFHEVKTENIENEESLSSRVKQ